MGRIIFSTCTYTYTDRNNPIHIGGSMKDSAIEPFWDVETIDPIVKPRRSIGRPRGVMRYRAVMTTNILEECMDKMSVHNMPFKHSFIFSIKKHIGKNSYKYFRNVIEKNKLITTRAFLDEKWLKEYKQDMANDT